MQASKKLAKGLALIMSDPHQTFPLPEKHESYSANNDDLHVLAGYFTLIKVRRHQGTSNQGAPLGLVKVFLEWRFPFN